MNKNKIIMSAIGGVCGVVALVLGYFIYAAWEEKSENIDSLDSTKSTVERISKAKIAPSQDSVNAIGENTKNLAIWFDKAFDVAARGDKKFSDTMTPAEFTTMIRREADEERQKPGGLKGKIAADDFNFDFADILEGKKTPEPAELPLLQRQWDDIKLFVDTLSDCGAVQIVSVTREPPPKPPEPPKAAPPPRGRNQRQQPVEEVKPLADGQAYTLCFKARPLALVKTINQFAATERFVIVDSFSFERAVDSLGDKLGGKEKEGANAPKRGRGRGRGRHAAEEEAQQDEAEAARQTGVVIDPVSDEPFTVELKISTYDFGTKAAAEEAEAAEAAEAEGEEQK